MNDCQKKVHFTKYGHFMACLAPSYTAKHPVLRARSQVLHLFEEPVLHEGVCTTKKIEREVKNPSVLNH